ncbi:MAG: YceH family protein [Stenotrophomonas rhizophila]|uniref:YceH family protein n=1 Tax=Stenotrophomonas rhizophila TaxID=216778 RepID=UPI003D0F5465
MTDDTQTPALPVLNAAQARALGCLIEKEATTPDAYPLTVNAAQVAANQKTAREPVMALSAGDVHHALRQLESLGLARQQFSSRAERYEHRAGSALDLTRQQLAIVGLLLLRGPQTVNELLTRSERLFQFQDAEEVRHHIERMIQRGMAVQLPRASGQREDRYMHLLAGPVDVQALAESYKGSSSSGGGGGGSPALEARVQQLEATVAELQEQLAELRAQLGG